jgi:flagellar biosynthesis/type III secretory pathway protein FliH
LIEALAQPLSTLKSDLAEAVADGAQHLARLLVGAAVEIDPQALTGVVAGILEEAAEADAGGAMLRIHVPPDAVSMVTELIKPHEVEVIADEQLAPGDVRATLSQTSGDPAHRIEWDARLETRWEATRKALGLVPK